MVRRFSLGLGIIPTRARPVPTAPPVNTVLPSITGILTQGQTLTADPGSWTGLPSGAFTYQWQRSGSNISGATNSTYVAQSADVSAGASAITVEVTATNDLGSTMAESAGVTIAAPLSISGTPGGANVGAAYGFTPSSSGGHTPKTYALTGTLPEGLSFNTSTGAITGTPVSSGTASGLDITVTDADELTESLGTFSIVVSAGATAAIEQLEIISNSYALDPVGAGPYDYNAIGALLRMQILATVNGPISDLVAGKVIVTIESPGFDNNGGAGPIAAVTRTLVVRPRAVLRRQANTTSGGSNITHTTQIIRQGGSLTAAPTLGVAADYFLVLPVQVFAGDVVTVEVEDGWNGAGSTAGLGPVVTNNSDATAEDWAQPLYGWFNTPCEHITGSTMAVELQVGFHAFGYLGGLSNVQMVAGVDIWATDGTNDGPVSQVCSVELSQRQTVGDIAEVFRVPALSLSGVNDTDGTTTLGAGRAYLDAIIYPWRGVAYQVSVDGVAWPTPQPCTVHPFVKDTDGKFAGDVFAPVRSDGALTGASTAGIVNTYPGSQPTAANSYSTINHAMTALAAYLNNASASGRPGGAIAHNNPAGGRVLLVNTTGAAQGFELSGTYTPTAAMQTYVTLENWSGNAFECFYNAVNSRIFTGGFIRGKGVRFHKDGAGNLRSGDTTANSVATLVAWEDAEWTWGASTSTPPLQQVAMAYFFNIEANSPVVSNPNAGGLSQETTSPYRCAKAIGFKWGDDTSLEVGLRPYHVVGFTGRISAPYNPTAARQSTNDGFVVYNCRFNAFTGSLFDFHPVTDAWEISRGACVWQNEFEGIGAGGCNAGFNIGSNAKNVRNVGWGFNTGAYNPADDVTALQTDDRNGFSLFYRDDLASKGFTSHGVIAGNLTPRIGLKGDYFTAINAGDGVGSIGAWSIAWGLGCFANALLINRPLNNINDAAVFGWRANDAATVSNLGLLSFENNKCTPGAGGSGFGFGDYRLKNAADGGNNVGKGVIPAGQAWNRYDAAGVLRKNAASGATNTTGAAGRYEARD